MKLFNEFKEFAKQQYSAHTIACYFWRHLSCLYSHFSLILLLKSFGIDYAKGIAAYDSPMV